MDFRLLLPIALSLCCLPQCTPARILALIPFSGKSHYINIQPILQTLAERGHDLTVVTTHTEKHPLPNYHQIVLDNRTFWDSFGKDMDKFSFENMVYPKEMKLLWDGTYFSTEVAFNSTSLRDFIRNDNTKYDLIFLELFFQEAFLMFAHKYKAPIVAISTMGFTQYAGEFMGNPLHMAYMPHEFLPTERQMNLWKRLMNLFYTSYDILGRKFYLQPKHERLLEHHFENLPRPLPNLRDIEKTISLVLTNTHYSIDVIRPHVPGIVEIGGVHIKETKKLPESLQKFLDEAEHGVVFFSLGSNLKSKDMPKAKIDMFLNVFSKLKQRVLWKWEDENMPRKPTNVFTGPWLPQTDILAHPNIKVFMFHGGLLSTLEAIHFGTPVVVMPVYGDQHLNADKAESLGFGTKLAFRSLTEETITKALMKILENPKYSENAKELSTRFRDRPQSPMDTAIYWTEYVINHKGANFMRSPVLDLEWYEFHMVDAMVVIFIVIAILLGLFVLSLGVVLRMATKQWRKISRKTNSKKIN